MTPRFPPRLAGIVAAAAMPLAMVACGDDAARPGAPVSTPAASTAPTTSGEPTTAGPPLATGTAPPVSDTEQGGEYEIVSATEVADGFASTNAELVRISADAALATDDAVRGVFERWESYEGTVKQNAPDSYLALEDALSAFKSAAEAGDPDTMASAAEDFAVASGAYLAAHPAG